MWCTGLVGTGVYLCLCAGCHCVIVSPSVHTYVHRHVSVGVHCAVYIRRCFMCATAEGIRTYMYMCGVCSPCVLYMRDHRVNPPSQPLISSSSERANVLRSCAVC